MTLVSVCLLVIVVYSFGIRESLIKRATARYTPQIEIISHATSGIILPEDLIIAEGEPVWQCGNVFTTHPIDSSYCNEISAEQISDYRGNSYITPPSDL